MEYGITVSDREGKVTYHGMAYFDDPKGGVKIKLLFSLNEEKLTVATLEGVPSHLVQKACTMMADSFELTNKMKLK